MQKVYVVGHRNPDTDSVCAPYSYAWLKSRLFPGDLYIPGVLGSLNPQTEFIFSRLGIEAPELIRDVYPKAEDVMLKDVRTVHENDPVGLATKLVDEYRIRTIPVVDDDCRYTGLITVLGLAQYFMPKHYEARPHYILRPENFIKVIPGFYLQKGLSEELEIPLMVGAMAFDTFIKRLDQSLTAGQPSYPLLIVGNRPDIIEYSLRQDFQIMILTGMSLEECSRLNLKGFKGWIYVSEVDTAETVRLLRTSIPVKAIADRDHPCLKPGTSLSEIKKIMKNLDHNGLAVLENGKLCGLVTNSCLIDPPQAKVIMVDHNEPAQSVEGIEEAEIIEILDHHRLGSIRTKHPIYVYARPLGSSCTIVYKHFLSAGITPPKPIAALLLSGILSDTIILRSPTTTPEDVAAAKALSTLAELDPETWGTDIFRHAASLTNSDPDKAIAGDFKIYTEHDTRVGISQMEVITLNDLAPVKESFLEALDRVRQKFALDWAMLMITDIIGEESILLSTEFSKAEHLIYHPLDKTSYHLPGVLSRKKQLLPEILHVLSK